LKQASLVPWGRVPAGNEAGTLVSAEVVPGDRMGVVRNEKMVVAVQNVMQKLTQTAEPRNHHGPNHLWTHHTLGRKQP